MSSGDIETRLRRMEDFEAIRQLKAFYAKSADSKYTDDHRRKPQAEIDAITRRQVDTVFTEDGIWDGGSQFGAIHGGRRSTSIALRPLVVFAALLHPSAHRNRRRHRARNLDALAALHLRSRNRSMLMSAITEDDYVRTPSGWQLKRYTFILKFLTPHDRALVAGPKHALQGVAPHSESSRPR